MLDRFHLLGTTTANCRERRTSWWTALPSSFVLLMHPTSFQASLLSSSPSRDDFIVR